MRSTEKQEYRYVRTGEKNFVFGWYGTYHRPILDLAKKTDVDARALSAGMVKFTDAIKTYGKSEGLGISPDYDDDQYLNEIVEDNRIGYLLLSPEFPTLSLKGEFELFRHVNYVYGHAFLFNDNEEEIRKVYGKGAFKMRLRKALPEVIPDREQIVIELLETNGFDPVVLEKICAEINQCLKHQQ